MATLIGGEMSSDYDYPFISKTRELRKKISVDNIIVAYQLGAPLPDEVVILADEVIRLRRQLEEAKEVAKKAVCAIMSSVSSKTKKRRR